MPSFKTETGCTVRTFASDQPEDPTLHVYLELRMEQEGDGRRAELKMDTEEAKTLIKMLEGAVKSVEKLRRDLDG